MTEATDRPQGAGEVSSTAVTPKTEIGAMPAMSEPYRPLSLLALAGFGVAVLYAFIIVLGGMIALFNRLPWLMPVWTFLIPLAALVMCWTARARIRDSEGTLSGLAFTAWGFRLAIVVGLTYAAYYGFTFFAVRLQALDCANQFFAEIEKGRPDKAFLLAMGAAVKGVEEDEMRDRLENLYNTPQGPNGGGAYSRFRQGPLVRAVEMADGQAHIIPVGVAEWEYKDGYRVVLKYHIATPLSEFDYNVETFGRDSKPGQPRGRQWQVDLQKGQTGILPATLKLTPRGEEVRQMAQMAWNFASAWQDKINQMNWSDAFLDTLPPSEREQLRKQPPAGWQKLAESDLIRIDKKRFWTGKAQREDILQHIRNTFRGGKRTFFLRLQQSSEIPLVRVSDGRATARLDAQLTYLDAKGEQNKYVVEGQLIVSAAEEEGKRMPSAWRVEGIDLESGRTPPERPRPPG